MEGLSFNKVCELEDFADEELVAIIRDVFRHEMPRFSPEFPAGVEYRKYWEIAMSVRSLRRHDAMRPDAVVLGVGAGTEVTGFYLANHVRQVFATDLYLTPGEWRDYAPGRMLVEPEAFAPYDFDKNRLVAQHMDARHLRFPDSTFDGLFSSSSIEHFGSTTAIANAAYEMGRVLKPGGILTLSTEFWVSNPAAATGMDLGNLHLFTIADLQKLIIEASGLELVDSLNTSVSISTMRSTNPLSLYLGDNEARYRREGKHRQVGETIWSRYPHIVLEHQGQAFTSVHLTLRKPHTRPIASNDWAVPDYAAIASTWHIETPQPKPFSTPWNGILSQLKALARRSRFARDLVRQIRRIRRDG